VLFPYISSHDRDGESTNKRRTTKTRPYQGRFLCVFVPWWFAFLFVIPAEAGIQQFLWIPAFAGMTARM
jgi:hypothetical protein